jgi:hypothetical protein
MIEPMLHPSEHELAVRDVEWRAGLLRASGIGRRAARAIAASHDVDVHELVVLLERGCPLALALRILRDDRAVA